MLLIVSFLWPAENNNKDTFYNKSGLTQVNLIDSDIQSTSLEVVLNGYEFIEISDKPGYYKIACDKGTPILNKGLPNLPKINTSIIIPDDSNMEVSVIDYEYEDIHNINIIPSKGNFTRDINPSSIPYSFDKSYKKDKFYPGDLVEMGDPYILRDLRGQGVVIYPFQYNPFTNVLRIYTKMTLDIKSTSLSLNGKNYLSRENNDVIKQSNEFKNIYDNLFINYNNDTRFEYIEDVGNMLIVSYDDFVDEMEPFVTWKNKKGIPTEIVGLNSIGSSASDIQTFVNNYYYENGLTYLLLVGDIAQMPTHVVGGSASDPTFGFIEGDDAFSEIIVGRFSANNPSELLTQIERSIQYEKDPSENIDHFNQALGIASTQGPGYAGLTDSQFNDLLWNDFLSDYTYESYTGLYDGSGSVDQGVSAINEGVGVINYTGHAGPTGWGNGAPLGVNDVNNLTNTNKLPFIFTVGCNPGQFNDFSECFCEAWMRATDENGNPTGAIGHLGSTISQSWEPPMHGQWAMNAILTESYEENVSRSYGGISVNGCMHMNEAQGSAGINETKYWTLFGDPSLIIRTDEPEDLNPAYDNIIAVGQTEFVVDVGVDGALVALSLNGELLSSSSSIGGVAILDITDISINPGQIDIVITSFNSYTHEDTITIITPDGAFLAFSDIEIVSDSNLNDYINYGDQIVMNLLVENIGNMNTNAINVSVTSQDEFITMINGDSMIAYAIVNSIAETEEPISFSVSENVPDGHSAQFSALLNNDEVEFTMNFNIEIHAPVFEIENAMISDENQDGIWDPGETAIITVDLINSGTASFYQYPGAIITTDNSNIEILSGENDNTFYGIDPNSSYTGSFTVYANESIALNSEIDFNISWGYSPTSPCNSEYCVEQANTTFSTIVGHPSILIWDPSDQHISGIRLSNYFNENNIAGF
ncbi:MAG: hypothetical protein CMD65_02250, partial [Gammaproteobacteria bacterium]|nr:hypothetical protein [Gammaproteobacteria bacterium]